MNDFNYKADIIFKNISETRKKMFFLLRHSFKGY